MEAGRETNKKGVTILFRSTFEFKLYDVIRDPLGCYLVLDIEILNKRISLVNIYDPSAGDNPQFFETIENLIEQMGNELIIIRCDFKCALVLSL